MKINANRDPATLRVLIEPADELTPEILNAVEETIGLLDRGHIRVASRDKNQWIVHGWIKKAILLYFKSRQIEEFRAGDFNWFDKIPNKKWKAEAQVRSVPLAMVRRGAYVSSGAILMPSYVNIGAYIGSGTMIDTWATVGSCAQIGADVHISGGVGIGGVLEPLQAQPVIIEDNAFIGSRCIVVEGVRVEEGAVLGAGVVLTASTKIIDVTGNTPQQYQGHVPKNSVVIPGSTEKKFAAGTYGVPCALIIGKRTPSTDLKTSLNQTLREFEVPV